jgi:hypothetical protein
MRVEELARLCGQLGSERQSRSLGRCRKRVAEERSEIRDQERERWALTQGRYSCGSEIRRLEAGNGDQRPTQLAPSCLLPTWPSNRRLTGAITGANRWGHGGETLAASNHCCCWRALAALPCVLLRPPVAVQ